MVIIYCLGKCIQPWYLWKRKYAKNVSCFLEVVVDQTWSVVIPYLYLFQFNLCFVHNKIYKYFNNHRLRILPASYFFLITYDICKSLVLCSFCIRNHVFVLNGVWRTYSPSIVYLLRLLPVQMHSTTIRYVLRGAFNKVLFRFVRLSTTASDVWFDLIMQTATHLINMLINYFLFEPTECPPTRRRLLWNITIHLLFRTCYTDMSVFWLIWSLLGGNLYQYQLLSQL